MSASSALAPANRNARADAADGGFAPRLIYDFDVMIDGEHRATFDRDYTGKGYYLQDPDHRPIDPPLAHYATGRRVDAKAQFEATIAELLAAGKIPTLAELAAKREADAQAKAAKIAAEQAKMRERAIAKHAGALYAALSELLRCAGIPEGWHKPARDAIAAADADADAWAANVAAEPGRFGIY